MLPDSNRAIVDRRAESDVSPVVTSSSRSLTRSHAYLRVLCVDASVFSSAAIDCTKLSFIKTTCSGVNVIVRAGAATDDCAGVDGDCGSNNGDVGANIGDGDGVGDGAGASHDDVGDVGNGRDGVAASHDDVGADELASEDARSLGDLLSGAGELGPGQCLLSDDPPVGVSAASSRDRFGRDACVDEWELWVEGQTVVELESDSSEPELELWVATPTVGLEGEPSGSELFGQYVLRSLHSGMRLPFDSTPEEFARTATTIVFGSLSSPGAGAGAGVDGGGGGDSATGSSPVLPWKSTTSSGSASALCTDSGGVP